MAGPTPYQLQQATLLLQSARDALLKNDPEIAEDETLLTDILASDPATCEAMDCLDQMLRASVQAQRMAEMADKQVLDIRARRDRFKARAETLRSAAFRAMDTLGMTKRVLPDITASVRQCQPAVLITDESKLEPPFVRTKTEPNKEVIREALLAGIDVAGAELSNSQTTLSIRVR